MAFEVPHSHRLAQLCLQLQFQWSIQRIYRVARDGLAGVYLRRPRCLFPRKLLFIRSSWQWFLRDCRHRRRLLLENSAPTLRRALPRQNNKLFQKVA